MTRFLLGVGLMLALLAAGLYVGHTAEDMHAPVSALLTEAADAAEAGLADTAIGKAVSAREKWNRGWHAAAAFSDHAPMDEIDGLFAQLENKCGTELAALCRRIASGVSAVAEAHTLNWWNLL